MIIYLTDKQFRQRKSSESGESELSRPIRTVKRRRLCILESSEDETDCRIVSPLEDIDPLFEMDSQDGKHALGTADIFSMRFNVINDYY